jgi:hypothetical protein
MAQCKLLQTQGLSVIKFARRISAAKSSTFESPG